jgi:general secretion pathway protein D
MRTVLASRRVWLSASLIVAIAGQASGQDAAPASPPPTPPPAAGAPAQPSRPDLTSGRLRPTNGQRVVNGEPTELAFKSVTVEQLVPFIAEVTGKVVVPQQDIMSRKVTVLSSQKVPRAQALDLVLMALQQFGIAVVETETVITLRDMSEVTRQAVPVLGPDDSTLERTDFGTIAEKVFRLNFSTADGYQDVLKNALPDYAKVTVDKDSNQIAILGNIALLQRMERLIGSLDRPPSRALQTETFRLRYADATQISNNIKDLFTPNSTSAQRGQNRQNQQGRNQGGQGQFFRFPGQGNDQASAVNEEIRVSANTQQNSVTVVADAAVLDQIRAQINEFWDKPLSDEQVVPRIYDLVNSDAVKMRTLLENMFGRGTTGTGAQQARPQGQGGDAGAPQSGQGIGRLAGQFSFEAMPESNRLVVIAKSPDNLAIIDKIIQDLDKVQSAGLPAIVELKHASSEDLAEQLNALLAQDGTLASIQRAAQGLSTSASNVSPFSTNATTQNAQQDPTQQGSTAQSIAFWWQRSRPPTDRVGASNLIGQIRIVPVWRQNALMVLAAPEYRNAIVRMIEDLDKPGRQVLISAIVAEVQRDDATALGLRWSSQNISPTNADNSFSIGASSQNTKNDFLGSLFDTSVLNVNANLNLILQALAQKTAVAILSEPKVFTSDNQEAEFFSGQDIPFVTDSQTNSVGNLVQSFDYRAVGIALRVRPRITLRRDVDLRVNVELSSIVPGQTLFGGFIVDRRETTTQVIVQNGQTIVISGILRSENSDIVRKVPLLGDIPIIGAIFRSKETSKKNTELLVFITPLVVDNPDAAEDINIPYRERLREQFKNGSLDPAYAPDIRTPAPNPPQLPPVEKPAEPAGPAS